MLLVVVCVCVGGGTGKDDRGRRRSAAAHARDRHELDAARGDREYRRGPGVIPIMLRSGPCLGAGHGLAPRNAARRSELRPPSHSR